MLYGLGRTGAPKSTIHIAKELKKSIHFEPIIICVSAGGPLEKVLIKNDIKYYIFNYESIFDLKAYITFYKLFKKIDIDIVHTQLYPAHFYGRVSGFCSNVPLIVSTYRNSPLWIKSKNIKSRLKNGLISFQPNTLQMH